MELELHQDKDLLNTITRSTQTEDQNSPSDIVKVIKNVCSRKSIELESTDVELFLMSTKLTDMAMEQITKIIEIALGNGPLKKVHDAKVKFK